MNQTRKWLFLFLIFISFGTVEWLLNGCGHKAKLNAPPPRKPEKVIHFGAYLFCGKVELFWSPIFFDTRGDPIKDPVQYLVFRKRNDIAELESMTPSPTPTATSESPETKYHFEGSGDTPVPDMTPVATTTPSPTPTWFDTENTETPTPTPTHIQPDYDYKLIGIVEGKPPADVTSDEQQTDRIHFEDDGLPGVYVVLGEHFRPPKQFPPEKTDEDLDLLPGYQYSYRIVVVNKKGFLSEPSFSIDFPYIYIPEAPRGFKAEVSERAVTLSWQPPEKDCQGNRFEYDILGYYIERSETGDPDEFDVIATLDTAQGTQYIDTSIQMDAKYFYRARAWVDTVKVPGEYTDILAVDTTDRFPPKRPAGLRAAAAVGGIHLIWDANREPDIAGYKIYRSTASEGPFEPLNETPINQNYFTDETVVSGRFYVYRITALDRSKQQNESEPSDIVRIIYP